MTKAENGLEVRTQIAYPRLVAKAVEHDDPVIEAPDVLIVGGGAGGLSAAITAAEAGAQVLLLDERHIAGGQYYKQRGDAEPPLDRQQAEGHMLFERAQQSGARILDATEVWGAFEGPIFHAIRGDAAVIVRPKVVVVATGAFERPRFVPGWDLPGVMTTGAAQTLWRSYGTLPGRRVAIVGNGPLNFQVADELRAGGAEIVVVAEAATTPWTKAAAATAMMAASPRLTVAGLTTTLRLMRRGVPLHYGTVATAIDGERDGLRVTLRDDAGHISHFEADVVCMNYGFHPQNEILRLLGASFDYDPARAQLICRRSDNCETMVPGLFAVGDCCGLGGAPAAIEEGRIAGCVAVAWVLGREAGVAPAGLRRLARHRRFQKALWTLFAAEPQRFDDIALRAPVCRCEGVNRAEIEGPALEQGIEIGGVKRATRAGMGRCQGRYCAQVLAPKMAAALGRSIDERAFFAPRVPIKPVEIAAILAAEEAGLDVD
ncbi:MAG: NAD(P)/FAD-dependent oxidoreductase [Alphaproteobacteria bacterium]|nr:NAD(P)/FAD-dependent oxidoreductase [Alphaproteobacteria bacterium]